MNELLTSKLALGVAVPSKGEGPETGAGACVLVLQTLLGGLKQDLRHDTSRIREVANKLLVLAIESVTKYGVGAQGREVLDGVSNECCYLYAKFLFFARPIYVFFVY